MDAATHRDAERASVFQEPRPQIRSNARLREPQEEAVVALYRHFQANDDPALVQIPVGCGKTGLMAILPFALSRKRTLVITPNVTIRDAVFRAVDPASKGCFWRAAGVSQVGPEGPFAALIDGPDASVEDCRDSHFVVANIQQLARRDNRWLRDLPRDFFDLLLIDEGHHNAANSWLRVIDHFEAANVVSLTATPFRGDGKRLIGELVYRYTFLRAMCRGYIKTLGAVHVAPCELAFSIGDEEQTCTLAEVMDLKETTWFSRGVALAPECNRSIIEASIREWRRLCDESGRHQQIIAAACSVEHAVQVASLYREAGLNADAVHSKQPKKQREAVLKRLSSGQLDAIVQVDILGEGFDHPPLAVAAVFRPFRTLAPFIQFIGRVMRVVRQDRPGDSANQGIVVSHVGLNTARHWDDFKDLDEADQALLSGLAGGATAVERPRRRQGEAESTADESEQSFSPKMLVSWEVLREYRDLQQAEASARPAQLPLLPLDAPRGVTLEGPQQRRRQNRTLLQQAANDAIAGILREQRLGGTGKQVARAMRFFGRQNNWAAVRYWVYRDLNARVPGRGRGSGPWSLEQTEAAIDAMPEVAKQINETLNQCLDRREPWQRRGGYSNTSGWR